MTQSNHELSDTVSNLFAVCIDSCWQFCFVGVADIQEKQKKTMFYSAKQSD